MTPIQALTGKERHHAGIDAMTTPIRRGPAVVSVIMTLRVGDQSIGNATLESGGWSSLGNGKPEDGHNDEIPPHNKDSSSDEDSSEEDSDNDDY